MRRQHAATLLAALAYPHPDADLADATALQDLVAWLEHTKVRRVEWREEKERADWSCRSPPARSLA